MANRRHAGQQEDLIPRGHGDEMMMMMMMMMMILSPSGQCLAKHGNALFDVGEGSIPL
jgi:hypothetical protein